MPQGGMDPTLQFLLQLLQTLVQERMSPMNQGGPESSSNPAAQYLQAMGVKPQGGAQFPGGMQPDGTNIQQTLGALGGPMGALGGMFGSMGPMAAGMQGR